METETVHLDEHLQGKDDDEESVGDLCNTIRYSAMQCNAMQCNAMQCNAIHLVQHFKGKDDDEESVGDLCR